MPRDATPASASISVGEPVKARPLLLVVLPLVGTAADPVPSAAPGVAADAVAVGTVPVVVTPALVVEEEEPPATVAEVVGTDVDPLPFAVLPVVEPVVLDVEPVVLDVDPVVLDVDAVVLLVELEVLVEPELHVVVLVVELLHVGLLDVELLVELVEPGVHTVVLVEPVVVLDVQPVWAGLVCPMPWLRSHS